MSDVADYYQTSDHELARRYLGDRYPELNEEYFRAAIRHRYDLYPHIPEIADFERFRDQDVLEIGVGQGSDHYMFASNGAITTGIDITPKHCEITKLLFDTLGAKTRLFRADARSLPFPNRSFDHVYSCGVLLLFPEMERALAEIHRVLRTRGSATIMLYNKASIHYWLKTRLYYGWALNENNLLGRDTVTDWYTDGIGYPKTYHYSPRSLRRLFRQFSKIEYRTACLTPEQIPEVGLPLDSDILRWLENHFGFFLWVRAWI
ncbi:MAG: methyltransferase domain-containing protein [Candidatus Saccharimonadales bacterium]